MADGSSNVRPNKAPTLTPTECNHAYQGGNFCDRCGAKLAVLRCLKCGVGATNKDAKFCFNCGAKLDQAP